jgi:hypothetical protein
MKINIDPNGDLANQLGGLPKKIKYNLKFLQENNLIGLMPYLDSQNQFKMSNCLGTALFVHGIKIKNRPIFVPKIFEENFKKEMFENVRKPGSIMYVRRPDDKNYFHSAVMLAEDDETKILFYQEGYGGNFSYIQYKRSISDLLEFSFDFYYPREDKIEEIKKNIINLF